MRGPMAPALRMPARGSSMMSLPATLRRDRACKQPFRQVNKTKFL